MRFCYVHEESIKVLSISTIAKSIENNRTLLSFLEICVLKKMYMGNTANIVEVDNDQLQVYWATVSF